MCVPPTVVVCVRCCKFICARVVLLLDRCLFSGGMLYSMTFSELLRHGEVNINTPVSRCCLCCAVLERVGCVLTGTVACTLLESAAGSSPLIRCSS